MTERLTNIELLIMLSEDVRAQGDELTSEMHQRGAAHARRVTELLTMLERARNSLLAERDRYSHYLPIQQPQRASAGGQLAGAQNVAGRDAEPKMPSFLSHKSEKTVEKS